MAYFLQIFTIASALLILAPRAHALEKKSKETHKMTKIPRPPQSTLDLQRHAEGLRIMMSIAYTGNADWDVASMLLVQKKALVDLAQIELAEGKDPEMRAIAQKIIDAAPAEEAIIKAWKEKNKPKDL